MVENRERDRSIKILRYMLASFVVCFSSWVVLELLGSLGGLGINAGIYIGNFLHFNLNFSLTLFRRLICPNFTF